jgi:hypothetical protein
MEVDRSTFKILTDITVGNKPLRSYRRRWADNIRIYHKEIDDNMGN